MLTTLQHEQSLPFPKLNDETDRPFALFIKLYPDLAEIRTVAIVDEDLPTFLGGTKRESI